MSDLEVHPSSSIFVVADKTRLDVAKVRTASRGDESCVCVTRIAVGVGAQAVITGPTGTPYCGGVFEFDVYFPADYPQSPPLLYFETGARSMRRFNPNLCVPATASAQGPGAPSSPASTL